MPGVIMENGSRNGSHTNHDRDRRSNGINGASYAVEKGQDKGKGRAEPQQNMTTISHQISNGLNGSFADDPARRQASAEGIIPQDIQGGIAQLPPEIVHITQGYVRLPTILSRLAQQTHNKLTAKILELAQMPVPASAVNGNAPHPTSVDDNSVDNLNKKLALLNFAQDTHADWVKALVLTEWSRKSEDVSKIIDLKVHLDRQRTFYDLAVHEMSEVKRSLVHARLPNPDLKTALEVLSTGKAPWMPELGYIEPPPLTARQLLAELENINTLLSIRLNLHEYDRTPPQFKDYVIKSGRVTFRVPGEFEVDLTIADEDPETQFWFIDFRFLFLPSVSGMSPHLRFHIESRVNAALLKDGLSGCYKYLHEMVLTQKISEFRRQAVALARGRWIEGVKVEPLNRALSIQYWLDRYGKDGPNSWIILGVHSGKRKDGLPDPKATSRLFLRWFRDSKEVKDAHISFDTANISAESLLKAVIAKHVSHILTSANEKIREKPLFATCEAALSLYTSSHEPAESELKLQLTCEDHVSVRIEPITGRFIFSPASRLISEAEMRLNTRSRDPASDAHVYIETLRCLYISEEIFSRGLSVGWVRTANPGLKPDDLKPVIPRDTIEMAWYRRPGWSKDWFIAVTFSMSGERWWLMEIANAPIGSTLASSLQIPIKAVSPVHSYGFLSTLHIFAAALVSHYTNLRALHARRALHMLRNSRPSSPVRLPSIYVRLSELLPSKNKSPRTGKAWAKDILKLTFQGIEAVPPKPKIVHPLPSPNPEGSILNTPASGTQPPNAAALQNAVTQDENVIMITEARMIVPIPAALAILKEKVDRDIAFHAKSGAFAFRLRSRVGESVIPLLVEHIVRVERLVDFVEVLHKHEKVLQCETISLGKIIFKYGNLHPAMVAADEMDVDEVISRGYKALIDFGAVDNIMTLVLERGNPHLRVLDSLTKVLNESQGLDGVATFLPLTLPALCGLDTLESAWAPLSTKGEVYIFVRAVEWYVIRYNLFQSPPPSNSSSHPKTRKIMFEVKLMQRRGEPWWYVRRTDPRDRDGDDIDNALKPLWNSSGEGWRGMRVNAVAQPGGVEELLGKVDKVLRVVAAGEQGADMITTAAVPSGSTQALARSQLATPAQTQSQGQAHGRNNVVKREVVEID